MREGALWFALSECYRECLLKWKRSIVYGLASPFISIDPKEKLASCAYTEIHKNMHCSRFTEERT